MSLTVCPQQPQQQQQDQEHQHLASRREADHHGHRQGMPVDGKALPFNPLHSTLDGDAVLPSDVLSGEY